MIKIRIGSSIIYIIKYQQTSVYIKLDYISMKIRGFGIDKFFKMLQLVST